uniref:Septin-type G domain-containing protein n=1 Tax=Coccolithus braarudii TaxID=221442 RepID=A0A7S0KYJ2_9EUKA
MTKHSMHVGMCEMSPAITPKKSMCLTAQLQSEWQRSGINFRVMLVGESGLGKTTFTRALFRPYVSEEQMAEGERLSRDPIRARTTKINEIVHDLENDGYPIEFTVVDCPGYGDSMDSTGWIESVIAYVTSRFEQHYNESASPPVSGVANGLQRDGLVHVCLYFIAAHRLKGIDIEFMRRLEKHVNLVPVIAKADTMTVAERDAFRRLILSELRSCGVRIFELEGGEARTPAQTPANANASQKMGTTAPPPFAVSAAENGDRVYPWGTCNVEDPTHSDLSVLRSMLFATSMLSAKRRTLHLYEEAYAADRRKREQALTHGESRAVRLERGLGRLALLSAVGGGVYALGSRLNPAGAQRAVDGAVRIGGFIVAQVPRWRAQLISALLAGLSRMQASQKS